MQTLPEWFPVLSFYSSFFFFGPSWHLNGIPSWSWPLFFAPSFSFDPSTFFLLMNVFWAGEICSNLAKWASCVRKWAYYSTCTYVRTCRLFVDTGRTLSCIEVQFLFFVKNIGKATELASSIACKCACVYILRLLWTNSLLRGVSLENYFEKINLAARFSTYIGMQLLIDRQNHFGWTVTCWHSVEKCTSSEMQSRRA